MLPNLLIIDDDENLQRLVVMAAQDLGWRPHAVGTGNEALEALTPSLEAIVLDYSLPGINGIQTLQRIREYSTTLPVIMLSGLNSAETAVQALRAGAYDYITKPFELKRLFDLLHSARVARKNIQEPTAISSTTISRAPKAAITSENPGLQRLLANAAKAARLDSNILLTGESGTGKTHFAREIHRLSPRSEEDFITVSCPALPRELLESELFGHERGAFTGAVSSRSGRFEQATKGTLFLDEIGDLPSELQPKLLNVLQDREFFRVGGSKVLETNARIIAATNVDLKSRVKSGSFREDLYYRLNIIELNIPSLRERREDIPSLTQDILEQIAKRRKVPCWTLTENAADVLLNYDWPGNVRQLQNILERATAFTEQDSLHVSDFLHLVQGPHETSNSPAPARELTLQEAEREAFLQIYLKTGKNKAETARKLGIAERSVYNLIARHGIK
jgi:DNA-binding NtrC family response regulator